MNSLVPISIIPERLKRGLLIPIPKPSKDSSIKDNNRGITLLPALYKLFEKIIMEREAAWLSSNKVNDEIQSCGKSQCSSMHTAYLVQEAISYNVNKFETVYGGFLDTRKAFDTVWIEGLMHKLYSSGINTKAYLLIRNSYDKFMCTAMIGGMTGKWFVPMRGVHQGAPLSMHLYTLYINELLWQIKSSPHGVHIGPNKVTCPAHADDITLLTLYKNSMNVLMKICHDYSYKWRYSFNHDKTVVIIWGIDRSPDIKLIFGSSIVEPAHTVKHMGVRLHDNANSKTVKEISAERIGSARKVLYAAKGIGSSTVPIDTISLSRIYWAVAMPKMIYGLEVTPLSDQCLQELETAHRHHARVVQDIPAHTPKPAVLATVGWLSVNAYVSYLQIMFLIRILCQPANSIYRKVMIYILECIKEHPNRKSKMKSPVQNIYEKVQIYGLENYINQCSLRGSHDAIPYHKYKVKQVIWEYEKSLWKASVIMYKQLKLYVRCVSDIRHLAWWRYARIFPHVKRKVSCIVALLLGSQPKGMQRNLGSNICKLCGLFESCEHVLFECSRLNSVRLKVWSEVLNAMPLGMVNCLPNNTHEKTAFILSGMNSTYSFIQEWTSVYYHISKFVFTMYKERMIQYDEMME